MKIAGKTPGVNRAVHHITRPGVRLDIILRATPFGFSERLERELPWPLPPEEIVRDARGVPEFVDGKAFTKINRQDPAYRAACALCDGRRTIYTLVEGMSADSTVTFDAPRPDAEDLIPVWLDAVAAELLAAGFAEAELLAMVETIGQLNRGKLMAVTEYERDFLSQTAGAAAGGNTPKTPATPHST